MKTAAHAPYLTTSSVASQRQHRRLMIEQGRSHLERIAAAAAGAPYEPLPKRRRGRG